MEKPPLYQTRKFWAIAYTLISFFSIYLLVSLLSNNDYNFTLNQLVNDINTSLGATLFMLIGYKITGVLGGWLGVVSYYILQSLMIVKTFQSTHVRILYPSVFISVYLICMLATAAYLGGI